MRELSDAGYEASDHREEKHEKKQESSPKRKREKGEEGKSRQKKTLRRANDSKLSSAVGRRVGEKGRQ